jgi:hypothetical protein
MSHELDRMLTYILYLYNFFWSLLVYHRVSAAGHSSYAIAILEDNSLAASNHLHLQLLGLGLALGLRYPLGHRPAMTR